VIGTYNTTDGTLTTPLDNNDNFVIEGSEFFLIDADQPALRAFYRLEVEISE